MDHGVCELIWIKNKLKDLGIYYTKPMNLYYDNKEVIAIAQNLIQHDRTKHVEVNCLDHHFIKENLDKKIIEFLFVQSESQLIDVLTKIVLAKVFHGIIGNLGMINIYATT